MRKKTVCIRIGTRFEAECCNIVTGEGQVLLWANDIRYLGIYIVSASSFALWIMLNVPSIAPSTPFLGKLVESLLMKSLYSYTVITRSSADADNRLDAFSGQSRSTNIVPFQMLHIVSYCAIVTCL